MARNRRGAGRRQEHEGGSAVVLGPALDLNAAVAAHRDLVGLFETKADIEIDGSQVTRPFTPGLQVLAAAAKAAEDRKRAFRLHNPSAELRQALADIGLADLACPAETPS